MRRLVLAMCTALCGLLVASAVVAAPGGAATEHRAIVVVDLGNGTVRTAKITFSQESISGLEALQRGGFAPVTRSFGGLGAAVCALTVDGTVLGCPGDSTCLTCAAPNYWAYSRAPTGSSGWTEARAGAGATQVRDGDMEGWRWGTGAPPPFVPFDELWPPPTTTTTRPASTTTRPPAATTRPPTATTAPTATTTGAGIAGVTTTAAPGTASSTTAAAGATTTTARDVTSTSGRSTTSVSERTTSTHAGADDGDDRSAAGPPVVESGGGDAGQFLVFALVATGLVTAIVVVRVRKRRLNL